MCSLVWSSAASVHHTDVTVGVLETLPVVFKTCSMEQSVLTFENEACDWSGPPPALLVLCESAQRTAELSPCWGREGHPWTPGGGGGGLQVPQRLHSWTLSEWPPSCTHLSKHHLLSRKRVNLRENPPAWRPVNTPPPSQLSARMRWRIFLDPQNIWFSATELHLIIYFFYLHFWSQTSPCGLQMCLSESLSNDPLTVSPQV